MRPGRRGNRGGRCGVLWWCTALGAAGYLAIGSAAFGDTTTVPGGSAPGASGTGGGDTRSPGGVSTAAPSLGGFEISASGSGMSATYDQPNLPIPARPSLEWDVGYSTTRFAFGPSGQAVASSLYPGQVIASSGSQLGVLVPGVPLPPAPDWPIQAHALYPQGPGTASDDQVPGVGMDAEATGDHTASSAALGSPSGMGDPAAIPSGVVTAQAVSSSSTSGIDNGGAVAQSTASALNIHIAGGIISIGHVASTATVTSDGNHAVLGGDTSVSDVSISGHPVVVDAGGIHSGGNGAPITPLAQNLADVLSRLGITMGIASPSDTVQGSAGSRRLDGLVIRIDLTTLDKNIGSFAAVVPPQLLSHLPLPLPDRQIVTVDVGWVDDASAASPAFDVPADQAAGTGADIGTVSALPSGVSGASGGIDAFGTPAGGSVAPGGAAISGAQLRSTPVTSAVTMLPLFHGLGGGLIAVGVVLASGAAWIVSRGSEEAVALGALGPCEAPDDETGGDGDARTDGAEGGAGEGG